MPKYIVSRPAITLCMDSRSSRSPTTTSTPMLRNACARSSSVRTIARTALPCFNNSSVTVRPTPPTRPAAPVTRMGFAMFSSYALCLSRKRLQFGQDGGEIFRHRRMNMHSALADSVRRLCIHNIQQDVNYFIASGPEDRSTQNLFCFRINTDFDETLCLTFFIGAAHAAHGIFRNQCTTPGLPYFSVRHAASAQGRIYIQRVGLDPI